jgi:hypothetical protein
VRGVVSGGGRFGSGVHDGELAEWPAALRRTRVAWRLGRASRTRVRVGGCWRAPRVHLVVDAPWTRSTGGVRQAAGETEQAERREMEVRAYLRF